MKKLFGIPFILTALLGVAVLTGCDKELEKPADFSSFAVIHASPVIATNPGSDTLSVFVDTTRYGSRILYTGNSGYMSVYSGSQTINIRRNEVYNAPLYVPSFTQNFEKGKIYSFFVYDTTNSPTAQAKVLRLTDDLSLPAANMAKVRFLHLAPNEGPVDITYLRTSATPNDSVTIANVSYVGGSPNTTALSAFTSIPRGTYTVKVKTAGTQTVRSSSTGVAITTGASIVEGRILSLFLTGSAKGRALTIGNFRHY